MILPRWTRLAALALTAGLIAPSDGFAQRGGRGGGGMRGGGGGMSRGPSFSAPSRPSGGMGGGARPGGGGNFGGARPGGGGMPGGGARPGGGMPGGGARPGGGMPGGGARPGGGGAGGRPTTLPGNAGGGNLRPPTPGGGAGGRPSTLPGNIGGNQRPPMPGGGGAGTRPNFPGGGNGNNINRPINGGNGNNINRPINGGNNNNINRPINGGNTNNINRPINGGNTNNINRPINGGNTNNINRPINNGNINSGNIAINNRPNVNNITNVNNNIYNRNGNNWGYGGGGWGTGGWGGAAGGGYYGRPGYWGGFSNAYHGGWVNGYWHGANNANWGNWATGFGMGMAAWGLGSSIYNWGYASYSNPYYVAVPTTQTIVVQQPAPTTVTSVTPTSFDYSRPYNLDAPPPDQQTADASVDTFDQARTAFKSGDYAQALTLTDQAIAKLPNDTAIQEFRGLVLFALKDYDRAAAVLYSVLSMGPGWDWTTLIGLYPDVDTYTAQLRALETYRDGHTDSASAAFVLGYHYLTATHTDAAAKEFEAVVKLKPEDKLSAELLKRLTKSPDAEQPPAEPKPDQPAAAEVPAGSLPGTWTASPAQGTTLTLTITADNKFTWGVKDGSGDRSFNGDSTLGNNILTLAPPGGSPMVGRLTWKSATAFNFKAMGAGAGDPGLEFTKAQ